MHARHKRSFGTQRVKHRTAHARHDAHAHHDIRAVGQLDPEMGNGAFQRSH